MRVMVLVPHYRPDGGASAPLFTMLCEQLAARGHQVTALTAVPHYPSGIVPAEYRGKLTRRTTENGVDVIRVALPSVNRSNFAWRMMQFLSYQFGATRAGWSSKYDVVITATAAMQVWLPFALLSVLRHKPAVYSVHDIYPDVGVKMGLFRYKFVIDLVAGLEQYCLRHATRVRILSESFRPTLMDRGVPEPKLSLIYDWVDTGLIKPLPRDNRFAGEHNLVDRFVVLYAGNMGFLQGLDSVLDAADLMRDRDDVRFVLVGDGAAREGLVEKADKLGLSNVQFLGYQPFERMPEILATAHVSLVPLVRGSGTGALPSKILSILSSGRPVLVSVDEESEAWKLVERAEAGLCVPPESPPHLVKAILTLLGDKGLRERLGHNGRLWAERHHSPQVAAQHFEELLQATIESGAI